MKNTFNYQKTLNILAFSIHFAIIIIFIFSENYIVNLGKSIILQLGIFAYAVLIVSIFKKHFFSSIINTVNCLLILVFLSSYIEYHPYSSKTKYDLKVAHFNVLKFNNNHLEIIQSAKRSDADIISFQETDTAWINSLDQNLKEAYPYSSTIPLDNECFGLAVYSKTPINNLKTEYFGSHPNITGYIYKNGSKIHFIASHTIPPTTASLFKERNLHIQEIAQYLNTKKGAKIAIGDYNTTPWDNQLSYFKTETNLRDSRSGICATYPSWSAIARIPIDYIFFSKELSCTNFNTINTTSSDHFGIFGCYKINPKNSELIGLNL